MPNLYYCANCGTRLNVFRKALPSFGRIVELVEYHDCLDEPIPLDLAPQDVPVFAPSEGKDKFVQNLNELEPKSVLGAMSSADLRDRRPIDQVKSDIQTTAPPNVLDQVKNSIPSGNWEGDLDDD